MEGRFTRLVAALLLVLPLASCDRHILTYRFRLTVEVMTENGLRSGSSVIEVGIGKKAVSYGGGGSPPRFDVVETAYRGQSVEIDLDGKRRVFALTGSYPHQFFSEFLGEYESDDYKKTLSKLREDLKSGRRCTYVNRELTSFINEQQKIDSSTTYSTTKYGKLTLVLKTDDRPKLDCEMEYGSGTTPHFAYFSDINRPDAVMIWNDADFTKKIDAKVKLWRVIVEPTNDKPTLDMDKRVPWLNDRSACESLRATLEMTGCRELFWQPSPMKPPAGNND